MNEWIVFLDRRDTERKPFGPIDKIIVILDNGSEVEFFPEELVIENPSAKGYKLYYTTGKSEILSSRFYDPVDSY